MCVGVVREGVKEGVREEGREKEGGVGGGVTGDHLFLISATCPLMTCPDVSDSPGPFSIM